MTNIIRWNTREGMMSASLTVKFDIKIFGVLIYWRSTPRRLGHDVICWGAKFEGLRRDFDTHCPVFWLLSLPRRVPPSPIDRAPRRLQSSSQGTRSERFTPPKSESLFVFLHCTDTLFSERDLFSEHKFDLWGAFFTQARISDLRLVGVPQT